MPFSSHLPNAGPPADPAALLSVDAARPDRPPAWSARSGAPVEPLETPTPLRVLLVEDEPDHADLVAAYLADDLDVTIRLTHAPTVGDATRRLVDARADGHPFDVVLSDQRLPDSEPWETVERVVAAAGDAPVVALTSIGDTDIALEAMRQGAQDYLVKSELSPELLRRTLRYAVERARHLTELRVLNGLLRGKVREQSARVRTLSAQLAVAEQEERRRIAHMLHDDLQQRLFGLSLLVDQLGRATDETRGALLARAREIVSGAATLTRTLAAELSPPVLGTDRLDVGLRWLAERSPQTMGIEVEVDGEALVPDSSLRVLLFHLVRELLFNVGKHAGTRQARVVLRQAGGTVVVRVEDEGRGLDVEALREEGGGFGLASVRERLECAGGALAIDSAPGAGTRVSLTVPVGPAPDGCD